MLLGQRALFAAALGLIVDLVSAASYDYVLKSSHPPPAGWQATGNPSASHPITLRIALAQPNLPQLEDHLLEISDPSHARWREHLSKEEVEALSAPSDEGSDAVDAWLLQYGIRPVSHARSIYHSERSSAGDWVIVPNIPISLAEELLNTTYSVFTHAGTGKQLIRTTSYRVPSFVASHVDVVQPTDYFGTSTRALISGVTVEDDSTTSVAGGKAKLAASAAAPPFNLTLQQLKDLYRTSGYKPSGKHSLLGVTGYLEQYANLADLKQFYQIYLPPAVNTTLKVELINGAINSQNVSLAGVEANLDVQFAGGISYPIPNIFYSTYGRGQNTQPNISYEDNGNEPYDVFLLHLLHKPSSQLPQTLSTSYGEGEETVPVNYARRVCSLYAQVAARGVSALHASGDGGVGNGDATTNCSTPNHFPALFPASCPYITAVGATYQIPEVAVDFSGGGFSDYFTRPLYQSSAVSSYLRNELKGTYKGLYNAGGRAIPDVSAQGSRFEVVYEGRVVHVSGTSASTPAFAGVVSLLNDALVRKGKKPLGFLNPWIYSLKSGFNDITSGNNPGCGTPGFNATKGWDPVTGRGTPDFPTLLKSLRL